MVLVVRGPVRSVASVWPRLVGWVVVKRSRGSGRSGTKVVASEWRRPGMLEVSFGVLGRCRGEWGSWWTVFNKITTIVLLPVNFLGHLTDSHTQLLSVNRGEVLHCNIWRKRLHFLKVSSEGLFVSHFSAFIVASHCVSFRVVIMHVSHYHLLTHYFQTCFTIHLKLH